jgi:prepilin-type N-terminal cleavage/methylation domain-containing protein
MLFSSRNRGFSLPEVVVAVAILGTIAGLSFASLSSFSKREALDASARSVVFALRDARMRTMASVGDTRYGLRITATSSVFFQGASFSASASTNQTSPFGSFVRASSSVQDFIFERVTGNSSSSGIIELYLASDPAVKKTVRVQGTGLVDIQ